VVSAENLFPTPQSIAEQVADLADLMSGQKVLEPSAGTGALVEAAVRRGVFRSDVTAIEINRALADRLKAGNVTCADFLSLNGELGKFDRIVMNPPFDHGSDIAHIEHALTFLKEDGRLVAICAAGPRQREAFEGRCEWIDLPDGSFKEQGTGVSTAIVVFDN
jgi:16S rRNA G1207 methylase RsmC